MLNFIPRYNKVLCVIAGKELFPNFTDLSKLEIIESPVSNIFDDEWVSK